MASELAMYSKLHKISYTIIIALLVVLTSCEEVDEAPKVETTSVQAISCDQFYATANVISKGSHKIVDYGFIYSIYESELYGHGSAIKVSLGNNLGKQFSDTINLTSYGYSNYYFVRAYVEDSKGTVYGNILEFPALQPSVLGVEPLTASIGDTIRIFGENFTTNINSISVTFNNTTSKIISASNSEIRVIVPDGISSSYSSYITINVTIGQRTFYNNNFLIEPKFFDFSPKNGTWGTLVYISAESLRYPYGLRLNVKLDDVDCGYYSVNSNTLVFQVPNSILKESSCVSVFYGSKEYKLQGKFSMDKIDVSSISNDKLTPGEYLSIFGENIYPSYYNSQPNMGWVKIGNYSANIINATNNQINVYVPSTIPDGIYDIIVSNGISTDTILNAIEVKVPNVSDFSPKEVYCNSIINFEGTGFGTSASPYINSINGNLWIITWDFNNISTRVPFNWNEGNYDLTLNVNGINYSIPDKLKVLLSKIESFSPTQGTPGTMIEIRGKGLPIDQYYTSVSFGTRYGSVYSVSDTLVKVQVPSNCEIGAMKISLSCYGKTIVSTDDFTVN